MKKSIRYSNPFIMYTHTHTHTHTHTLTHTHTHTHIYIALSDARSILIGTATQQTVKNHLRKMS